MCHGSYNCLGKTKKRPFLFLPDLSPFLILQFSFSVPYRNWTNMQMPKSYVRYTFVLGYPFTRTHWDTHITHWCGAWAWRPKSCRSSDENPTETRTVVKTNRQLQHKMRTSPQKKTTMLRQSILFFMRETRQEQLMIINPVDSHRSRRVTWKKRPSTY